MVTVSCHTFQISSQYSAMARSDENFPLRRWPYILIAGISLSRFQS